MTLRNEIEAELRDIEAMTEASGRKSRARSAAFKSSFGGHFVSDMTKNLPHRNWLLQGAMLMETLCLVVGAPGSGKTFLALDLVMTMAHAVVEEKHSCTWFGRRIKPCAVVYVSGEGQADFTIRLHGWMALNGVSKETALPVFLIPQPIDMRTSADGTIALIEEIKKIDRICYEMFSCHVGAVVLDTLNRMLMGGDDTKAEHIGAFVKHSTMLREQLAVTVIAIAHTPKEAGRSDPRGHSSLVGDSDLTMFVRKNPDGAPNDWKITRNKAGPEGDRHEFRLRQIKLSKEDDDDPVTTCVVIEGASEASIEAVEGTEAAEALATGRHHMTPDGRSILPHGLTLQLRALQRAITDSGEVAPPDIRAPFGRPVVKMSRWTEEIVRSSPGDEKGDKFKDRCRKARDAAAVKLRNRGIIDMDGEWVWRTQKRVAMIDAKEKLDEPIKSSAPSTISSEDMAEFSANLGGIS